LANGFFQEEKVSEIRDRSSILEIVSDYVSLKKAGKNYRGLCPFHSEKTPSFMVNEEKQIFHCFGCGEGGDVFTFLMKIGHFSFPQAVEELAKRYGVRLPRREPTEAQKKEMGKKETLFQINRMASEYYHDLLIQRKEGEKGRRYLSQRGIQEKIIREYRLGYAIERWDGLVQYLLGEKVSPELAWELGLILPRKKAGDSARKEGWYDVFRNRIIFPIFDLHQRVVGFGGRLIGEGLPKYINSSESGIYHKGEILYGLSEARQYISEMDYVILVEGYFDLLTLHQFGLKNSVATLGTALTQKHLHLLKRYTENVITVFDPDQAGTQATLRALPLLLEEELTGKAVLLPKGEDPDTFLRKGNPEDFREKVAKATPLIEFFFDGLMKAYDVKSIDGKVKIAEEGMGLISKIPGKIRRDFYIKALAERLDIRESVLSEMIRPSPKDRARPSPPLKDQVARSHFSKSEEMVIRLMVHHPGLIPVISRDGVLREFESPLLKRLGLGLEDLYQRRGRLDLSEALGSFEEELSGKLREYAFEEGGIGVDRRDRILRDCIQRIRQRKLKREEKELLIRIKEAEGEGGGKGLEALLLRRQEMAKRERGLWRDTLHKE